MCDVRILIFGNAAELRPHLFQLLADHHIAFGHARSVEPAGNLEALQSWTEFRDFIDEGYVHYWLKVAEANTRLILDLKYTGQEPQLLDGWGRPTTNVQTTIYSYLRRVRVPRPGTWHLGELSWSTLQFISQNEVDASGPRPISAWKSTSFWMRSPDGQASVQFFEVSELRMGGPTIGDLILEPWHETRLWRGCSPSIVWSADSRMLAVPQWGTKSEPAQRVILIDVKQQRFAYSLEDYGFLELHSFEDRVLHGFDHGSIRTLKLKMLPDNKIEWER